MLKSLNKSHYFVCSFKAGRNKSPSNLLMVTNSFRKSLLRECFSLSLDSLCELSRTRLMCPSEGVNTICVPEPSCHLG